MTGWRLGGIKEEANSFTTEDTEADRGHREEGGDDKDRTLALVC
jgi:hypothetical protein